MTIARELALSLAAALAVWPAARALGQSGAWRLSRDAAVEIGATTTAGGGELREVIAATRLSSGHIALADRALFEIRVYDRQGRLVGKSGRRGRGPGDYQSIQRMWRGRADSLRVYDQIEGRVSVLTPRARFVRSWPPLGAAPRLYVRGTFADGSLLGELGIATPEPQRSGRRLREMWLLHISDEGRRVDTLPRRFTWQETLAIVSQGRSQGGARLPLGHYGHVGVIGDSIYYGDGSDGRVWRLNRRGEPLQEYVVSGGGRPLEPRERDSVIAAFTGDPRMPAGFREQLRAELRVALRERALPAYDSLLVDATGRPWIRVTRGLPSGEREWLVYARASGEPARVRIDARWTLLEVGQDYVLVTNTDEDGLTVVREYRLEQEAGEGSVESAKLGEAEGASEGIPRTQRSR